MPKKHRPLRVGFDLDGVLLYNPARILRPPVAFIKRRLLKVKKIKFYYPRTAPEKLLWRVFHWSSLFVSPGLRDIERLVREGKIEAYIITARFDFLREDTQKWYKALGVGTTFKKIYHNTDKQPHLHKKERIEKLKLDYFIDDNYDIVRYLSRHSKAEIHWLYNILDRAIGYPHKHSNVSAFTRSISRDRIHCLGKLLLVSEYFAPHWTGIAKAFHYVAQNLLAQGYSVTVLTTKYDAKLRSREKVNGIEVIRVPYQFRLSRTHYSFKIVRKFFSLLNEYDGVLINSPNSNILFYSVLTRLLGKRLGIYHQGDLKLPRETGNRLLHIAMERIFDLCTIPSFMLCHRASTYTRDYAEHSRVMRCALDRFEPFVPTFILPQKPKPSMRIKKMVDEARRKGHVVGFAGRFVEEKAYDYLLKAIPAVVKTAGPTTFLFAGAKIIDYEPYYDTHRLLIRDHEDFLTFLGLLNEQDLAYFYHNIDVFALSSRSDCFPTTQIEAATQKVPIVVTDIPGARMLVRETGFGEIVKVEDVASLAAGIGKVITKRDAYISRHTRVLTFFKKYGTFKFD